MAGLRIYNTKHNNYYQSTHHQILTFNLPNFQDRVIQGSGTRGSVGTYKTESLPNITGDVYSTNRYIPNDSINARGVFSYLNQYHEPFGSVSSYEANSKFSSIGFNASWSSSVYQNSAPVQQNALLIQCCIKY